MSSSNGMLKERQTPPTRPADGDRAVRNGAVRNGTVRNGAVRNGTVRNGAVRNGTVRNGAVRNGSPPRRNGTAPRRNGTATHAIRDASTKAASRLLDATDPGVESHSRDVELLAGEICTRLGIDGEEREAVVLAAQLHDVGKAAIPQEVLEKRGPLDADEWQLIKQHTIVGEQMLERVPELAELAPLVRHSHENFDGSGYPDGLRGEEIPLGSRIIFCVDAFHAIRCDRPYRKGRSTEATLAEIRANAGTQFDPKVVGALGKAIASARRHGRRLMPRRVALLFATLMIGTGGAYAAERGWVPSPIPGLGSQSADNGGADGAVALGETSSAAGSDAGQAASTRPAGEEGSAGGSDRAHTQKSGGGGGDASGPKKGADKSRGGGAGEANGRASPGRGGSPAGQGQLTPVNGGSAPGNSGSAPGHGGSPPGQGGSSPGQSDPAPGNSGSAPGKNGSGAGNDGSPPGKDGSAPGLSGSTPGKDGSAPGQSGSNPGSGGRPPGQSESSPGQSGSTPGQSGSAPGQNGSAPGKSESASGHGAPSPGNAASPPGLDKP